MKMNTLGRTGIAISELCLGTMTWGEQNTQADAFEQMDFAVEAGVNFFDTAEMYPTNPLRRETAGRTEEIIGAWLKARGKRDHIVLATKIVGKGNKTVRDGGPADGATMRQALDASLKRLGTGHVDLYQIHWPNRGSYHFRQNWKFDPSRQDRQQVLDNLADIVETAGALVKEGKIRALGVSNDSAWGIAKMLELAGSTGGARVASVQNEYNLLDRKFDLDLAELAHHEEVSLLAYSPLATGILTGKYLDGAIPEGSRRSITADLGGRWQEHVEAPMRAYVELARAHGLDPAHMALAFALSRSFMGSVIIGATTMTQLKTNIGAVEAKLSPEVLDGIQAIHRRYPLPV